MIGSLFFYPITFRRLITSQRATFRKTDKINDSYTDHYIKKDENQIILLYINKLHISKKRKSGYSYLLLIFAH